MQKFKITPEALIGQIRDITPEAVWVLFYTEGYSEEDKEAYDYPPHDIVLLNDKFEKIKRSEWPQELLDCLDSGLFYTYNPRTRIKGMQVYSLSLFQARLRQIWKRRFKTTEVNYTSYADEDEEDYEE